jgi:hypothetical protein
MELKDKIKTALDETRMLILGGQILLGFQLRGVFQTGYEHLPSPARVANGLALAASLLMVGLIIAPSAYHRIALGGTDTGDFHRLVGRFAAAALVPFAAALGLGMFIAIGRIGGMAAGAASGVLCSALALTAWFGVGDAAKRKGIGTMQRQAASAHQDAVQEPPLHARIEQMLTEARVILPGVQALLGFQFAIVLTEAFETLPGSSKLLHGLALGCVAISVMLLMAPAAYHRIVYGGEDAPEFLRVSGWLVAAATLPLAFGLAGDAYVVFARMASSSGAGIAAALVTLAGLIGFWHVHPIYARFRRARHLSVAPPSAAVRRSRS